MTATATAIIPEAAEQRAARLQMVAGSSEGALTLPLVWARDARPMLDTAYVVKGSIGRGELVVVYGPPKCGKTFLMTDLALSVAAGLPEWFGMRINPGPVVYVASEMGNRVQRRVRAWLDHRLGDAADCDPPLAIVPRVVNLLDELDVERLMLTIESLATERGNPALVVVDTLARSMVGGDENSALDMGRAIAVGDRLRDQFNTTTAMSHHCGKDTKGARGSSALLGAADCFIRVDADDQGNRTATIEWSRDGMAGEQFGFRLRTVELGLDVDGDTVTTCIVEPSDAELRSARPQRRLPPECQNALSALRSALEEHGQRLPATSVLPPVRAVRVNLWRDSYYARALLVSAENDDSGRKKEQAARQKAFTRARDRLLSEGLIGAQESFVWLN
jgi:KaiC/GvpD/RAD55 family RecA-like ATPase